MTADGDWVSVSLSSYHLTRVDLVKFLKSKFPATLEADYDLININKHWSFNIPRELTESEQKVEIQKLRDDEKLRLEALGH